MKMRLTILSLSAILLLIPLLSEAQKATEDQKTATSIKWMSIEEAAKLNKKHPKKFLIDLYTDWCSWCKKMDAETFTDPRVVEYINTYYYAVKLNAEQKEPIEFKGQQFVNANPDKPKSTHQLALALLKNERLYPSYVILDQNSEWMYKMKGYKTPEDMLPILKYYGEDFYLRMNWTEFSEQK